MTCEAIRLNDWIATTAGFSGKCVECVFCNCQLQHLRFFGNSLMKKEIVSLIRKLEIMKNI